MGTKVKRIASFFFVFVIKRSIIRVMLKKYIRVMIEHVADEVLPFWRVVSSFVGNELVKGMLSVTDGC